MSDDHKFQDFDININDENLRRILTNMQTDQQLEYLELIINSKSISDVVEDFLKILKKSEDNIVQKKAMGLLKTRRKSINEELQILKNQNKGFDKKMDEIIKIVVYDPGVESRLQNVIIVNVMKTVYKNEDETVSMVEGDVKVVVEDKYFRISSDLFDKLWQEKKDNNRWHYLIDIENKIMWNERIDGNDNNDNNKILNKSMISELFDVISRVQSNDSNCIAGVMTWKIPYTWDGTLPYADIQIIMRC